MVYLDFLYKQDKKIQRFKPPKRFIKSHICLSGFITSEPKPVKDKKGRIIALNTSIDGWSVSFRKEVSNKHPKMKKLKRMLETETHVEVCDNKVRIGNVEFNKLNNNWETSQIEEQIINPYAYQNYKTNNY